MLKLHFLLLVNMLKNILKLLNKLMKKDILLLTMAIAIIIHYCTKMKKVFEMKF